MENFPSVPLRDPAMIRVGSRKSLYLLHVFSTLVEEEEEQQVHEDLTLVRGRLSKLSVINEPPCAGGLVEGGKVASVSLGETG